MQFVKPKLKTIAVLIILAAIIGLAAWATYRVVERAERENAALSTELLGGDSSATRFLTIQGSTINLSDLVGQNVYIATWASWSPLSRDELVALNTVAGEYKDRGIQFLALNRKEYKEQAERFLETLPPLNHVTIVIDTEDYFYNQIGGYAMPETVVYNAAGDRVRHERQPLTESQMREILETLLKESE